MENDPLSEWDNARNSGKYVAEEGEVSGEGNKGIEGLPKESKDQKSKGDSVKNPARKKVAGSGSQGGTGWVQWATLGLSAVGFPVIVFLLLGREPSAPPVATHIAPSSKTLASKTRPGSIMSEVDGPALRAAIAKQVNGLEVRLTKTIVENRKIVMRSLWQAKEAIKRKGSNAQIALEAFYKHYAKVKPNARIGVTIYEKRVKPK